MPRKKTKKRTKKNNQFAGSREGRVKLGGLNDFSQRFEELSEIAGCKDACKLLTMKIRALMFLTRLHLTQPRIDKGEPIDKNLAKMLSKIFKSQRNRKGIELIEGKEKISIDDLYIIGCLKVYLRNEDESPLLDSIKSGFKPLIDAYDSQKRPEILHREMYDHILAMLNGIGHDMFSIKTSVVNKTYPSSGVFHIVRVKHHRPIKRNIVIDGKRRPIVKFGWPIADGNIWYLKIASEKIKEIYKGDKEELDVYIQSHAIRRFEERTKPLTLMFCRLYMTLVFRNILPGKVYRNKLYLSVYYQYVKIGYFVADIIDEKVIIRTFLFLTHNSTPEGKALKEFSGLQREDINYWHFDSLESFMANPPEEGSLLKDIMNKAGIEPLFELSELAELNENDNAHDVDWADVEEYIEKGREERLRLREEEYEEIYS